MGKEKNPRRVADNEAMAKSKMLRTSPQKLNLVAALIRGVGRIGREEALEIACFGHAGDGNVHVNFLRCGRAEREWRRALGRATHRVFSLAVGLGGTISGEHGIGITKKRYLRLALSPAAVRTMRRLKKALDPNNILNPGKIF